MEDKINEIKKTSGDLVIQNLSKFIKFIGNWIFIISISLSGFFIGYYYPRIKKSISEEKKSPVIPKSKSEITISVTDRGELMIIDRRDGTFEVFSEEVGMNVFKSYAGRITEGKSK